MEQIVFVRSGRKKKYCAQCYQEIKDNLISDGVYHWHQECYKEFTDYLKGASVRHWKTKSKGIRNEYRNRYE